MRDSEMTPRVAMEYGSRCRRQVRDRGPRSTAQLVLHLTAGWIPGSGWPAPTADVVRRVCRDIGLVEVHPDVWGPRDGGPEETPALLREQAG